MKLHHLSFAGAFLFTTISFAQASDCSVYFRTLEGKEPSKSLVKAFEIRGYKLTTNPIQATHIAVLSLAPDYAGPGTRGHLELYSKPNYLKRNWKNANGGYAADLTYSFNTVGFLNVRTKLAEDFISEGITCGDDSRNVKSSGNGPDMDHVQEQGTQGYL